MTLEGHIENGRVVLDAPVELPEGAKVRVEILVPPSTNGPGPSLYERLRPMTQAPRPSGIPVIWYCGVCPSGTVSPAERIGSTTTPGAVPTSCDGLPVLTWDHPCPEPPPG